MNTSKIKKIDSTAPVTKCFQGIALLAISIILAAPVSLADCPCGTIRVTTYPSIESFQSQTVCPLDGVQCSLPCTLASTGIWQNITGDDLDWTIRSGATPTERTGPNFDATLGTSSGRYAYLESSCPDIGHPQQSATLYSGKCFNFQGIVAPELSYAYHMYGEEMGEVRVEASIDNCGSWQVVDSISGPQQSSSTSAWKTRIANLLPYAGRSGVRLRFRGISGGDQYSDIAIDDIQVREALCCDVSATRVISPVNKCGMTSTEQISVELKNLGYLQQTGFPVSYSIDDGPLVTETFTGSLAPGATAIFTFATRANLSAIGEHTISILTGLQGDLRTTNDSTSATVVSIPTISTFPYSQNYETGKNGWTVAGTNPSWAFGLPAKSVITGAGSGTKSWVTGGLDLSQYPNNEASSVLSPCFNFSSLGFPVINLKTWWNAEGGYDGAVLQSSVDGGQTWQKVGAVDDSSTWYNNGSIAAGPGGQSSGWSGSSLDSLPKGSGGWVSTGNILTGLAGQTSVRLRIAFASDGAVRDDGFAFDDIVIQDGFSAQQTAAITLDSNSNGRADPGDRITYTTTLRNLSSRTITGVIFDDTPNSNTSLIVGSVTTTSGTIQRGNSAGNIDVRVLIPTMTANATVVVTFRTVVKVPSAASGPQICNQGSVVGNGFSSTPTDDPAVSGNFDPSCVLSYPDSDSDGVIDYFDLCPGFPDSQDSDNDGVPNGCDRCAGFPDGVDSDNDTVPNGCDGCPNDGQKSSPGICGCGIPDTDSDGDGTPNCNDQCPNNPAKVAPGVCGCSTADTDSDNDGTPNCLDQCPADPTKTLPGICGCGSAETDSDGDGAPNCIDQCPNDPQKTVPGGCGCGNPETDSDGDGSPNCLDACPQDPNKTAPGACGCGVAETDTNNNGIPDCLDECPQGSQGDADGDGTYDCRDGCPNDPLKSLPGICGCGVAETDTDFDGAPNCIDGCPNDPAKVTPGSCGCGAPETDSDGDGTPNCTDQCPTDPQKQLPGACGCGVAETDSDGDGTPNCLDQCPANAAKTTPGQCGCTTPDTDTDSDSTADCNDLCPQDPAKTSAGICGCGVADTDSDGDDIPNCFDQCPTDQQKTAPGQCGCGTPDTDTDSDATPNCNDGCPVDPNKVTPGACGCGQSDLDSDDDGAPNCLDECPADQEKTAPGGCGCGAPDIDTDLDGSPDCIDLCPADPSKSSPGICGCGMPDSDSDGDGSLDCNDQCPLDKDKIAPGSCGCGISDADSDGDGIPNCQDGCPNDSLKALGGQCGCGVQDIDTDGDGIPNCNDGCPQNPMKVTAGACGCAISDTDANGNGVPDCEASQDLRKELSSLGTKVRKLAVYRGKKGPQQLLRIEIKKQLGTVDNFIKVRRSEISIAKNKVPITKSFRSLKSAMSKLLTITSKSKLELYKRNTGRQISAIITSIK